MRQVGIGAPRVAVHRRAERLDQGAGPPSRMIIAYQANGEAPARHCPRSARPTVARCAQHDFTPSAEPSSWTSSPIREPGPGESSSTSPMHRSIPSTCGSRKDQSAPRRPTFPGSPEPKPAGTSTAVQCWYVAAASASLGRDVLRHDGRTRGLAAASLGRARSRPGRRLPVAGITAWLCCTAAPRSEPSTASSSSVPAVASGRRSQLAKTVERAPCGPDRSAGEVDGIKANGADNVGRRRRRWSGGRSRGLRADGGARLARRSVPRRCHRSDRQRGAPGRVRYLQRRAGVAEPRRLYRKG